MASKPDRTDLKLGLGAGLLAAVLATLCCTGPALLALLGLGGLAGSLALHRYHGFLLVPALLVLGGALWLARRRACCKASSRKGGASGVAVLGLSILLLSYVALNAWGAPPSAGGAEGEPAGQEIVLAVEGMTCSMCARGLSAHLKRVEGVRQVRVLHHEGRAYIVYDPDRVTPNALVRAVEEQGFQARPVEDPGPRG